MVNIHLFPKFYNRYIICTDDSLPPFDVDEWIIKDRHYRLLGWTDAINQSDDLSLIIADSLTDKRIQPNESHFGFRQSRFDPINFMDIYLN